MSQLQFLPLTKRVAIFALVVQSLVSSPTFAACSWQKGFEPLDVSYVLAMATWDDGHGSALYAAGTFSTAAGLLVNKLARWDGEVWSALPGLPENGVDAPILALAVWDDGQGSALYVGGRFRSIGGVSTTGIAKWDGQTWSALVSPGGSGLNGSVNAMTVWDDGTGSALYVGGAFTLANGATANRIAKWNGQSWSALSSPTGNGFDGEVKALAAGVLGGSSALFAGGYFIKSGTLTVNRIAKWNGSTWSTLASGSVGMNESVNSLLLHDQGSGPRLYVGGYFSLAGNVNASQIAMWDGLTWSALTGPSGNSLDGGVHALAMWDSGDGPVLYVSGAFQRAGGQTAWHIARWNGSAWSALADAGGNGVNTSDVYALAVWDDGGGASLYVGGHLARAGGVNVSGIAKWDDSTWSALETSAVHGLSGVQALLVWDDGSGPALYAAGDFDTAGRLDANSIAKWDGGRWWPLSGPAGNGLNGEVNALVAWDDGNGPALYAAGGFTTAGGVQAYAVAKWDRRGWSTLTGPAGNAFDNQVIALAVWDDGSGPALYAGGNFTVAGGISANKIAKWDGKTWSALQGSSGEGIGNGAGNWVNAMVTWNDGSGSALYVGGNFSSAGGLPAANLAKWNGSEWSALTSGSGNGVNNSVLAMTVWDNGSGSALYVGGGFSSAAGLSAKSIASWNGTSFSALTGPGQGTLQLARAIQGWDDGNGSALYVSGFYTLSAGGARRLSKWDGFAWSGLAGPNPAADPAALAVWDDGSGSALFVGSIFGKYSCSENTPQQPTRLQSIHHLEKGWVSATTLRMVWSGAMDVSGTAPPAGYSVLFDDQPDTIVDTVIDVPHVFEPHKTSSDVLPEGKWYFHLASCNQTLDCTATLHRGPYGIDSTAPSPPAGIESSTHSIGVPSKKQVVNVTWDAAADNLSGVAGYAWAFLPSGTGWVCDGRIDSVGLVALSPNLGAGSWHFHICALDKAGNGSSVATAGPFEIDLAPPARGAVDTVADTGDFDLGNYETTSASVTQLLVRWSEALDPASSTDLDHWLLVAAGADGQIDSQGCSLAPSDIDARPTAATLLADLKTVRLDVGSGFALPAGDYLLVACAGIQDSAGNVTVNASHHFFSITATNPLANPNFDSALAPWIASGTRPQDLSWSTIDAEGKATSGSLEVASTEGTGETTRAEMCIELQEPGPWLVFRGEVEVVAEVGSEPQVTLELITSENTGCTLPSETSGAKVLARGPTNGWRSFAISGSTGNRASVLARLEVSGSSAIHQVRLDQFHLHFEAVPLFSDGFESGDTKVWSADGPWIGLPPSIFAMP